jgi:PHP family Zn ribbon phosphoesterase
MASKKKNRMHWYRVDLHLHTIASADYISKDARYLDILRKAEQRGLDIIAFTDHNTVNGYAEMTRELEQLAYLEELGRAQAEELRVLAEYRRLLDKILVLPGFEFTATFGFHILGIFSPEKSVREIEHILLSLNVPSDVLDEGTSHVGASADVLTAYEAINESGGIVIAAHANTTHGVAMRGLDFGGQTRIAYTQDRRLHALEVTDLGRRGRTTQRFFDGTKPEYPRRMRCIQGSDSHNTETVREKNRLITLGVGERVTEVLLKERSFDALLEMFQSNDFSRSRPYNPNRKPEDFIQSAREEGPTMVQSFHESMTRKGGKLYNVTADVCAFANTNGGTVYVGISMDKRKNPVGIKDTGQAIKELQDEISSVISPPLNVDIDVQETQGKNVIRIQVPLGEARPYAMDNTKFYVRDEADTSVAIRDEIVDLVRQGVAFQETSTKPVAPVAAAVQFAKAEAQSRDKVDDTPQDEQPQDDGDSARPPRTGVEIVGVEQRNDTKYYVMRDLRNGNVVKNVTRSSARRLWHYAIKQMEANPARQDKVDWKGDVGMWRSYKKNGAIRYDLVQRENGKMRVYYGATEGGMHGPWQQFLEPEDQ